MAPTPWKEPFLIAGPKPGPSILEASQAGLYADERLTPGTRGVLVALLSYPAGSSADYSALIHSTPAVAQEALRDLYELGYLRAHERVTAPGGHSVGATLYGQTLLTEVVAAVVADAPRLELVEA